MGKLRDEAEKLGIEIDGRWSNQTLERKINEVRFKRDEEKRMATPPDKPVAVRLLKHHRPSGWYNVLGHYDADENFVAGEMAPPPVPGASMEHKLWAGTVVELPSEEARKQVENVAIQVVIDRDPATKIAIGRREVKQRKPLAELHTDWTEKLATNAEAVT